MKLETPPPSCYHNPLAFEIPKCDKCKYYCDCDFNIWIETIGQD